MHFINSWVWKRPLETIYGTTGLSSSGRLQMGHQPFIGSLCVRNGHGVTWEVKHVPGMTFTAQDGLMHALWVQSKLWLKVIETSRPLGLFAFLGESED